MKANCVNILNKTVSNVCLLDTTVADNTNNIEFLFKYMNFNKNLQLANLGCNIQICSCVNSYKIQPCFINDQLLQFFLTGILDYLNSLNKENYYFIAKNMNDIPSIWRNNSYCFPCVIEIGLIECDKNILTKIIDATKSQNFSELIPVINYLQNKYCSLPSYTLAILQFLTKMPDINLQKCFKQSLSKTEICKAYEQLIAKNNETHDILCCLIKQYKGVHNTQGILDALVYYLRKGYDVAVAEYKQKSFNDPFYPYPTQQDFIKTARNLFLEDNHLEINDCGRLIHNEPHEPFEPFEPFEPSEPSDYLITTYRTITDTDTFSYTKTESEEIVEMKIKQLLELTDTETESSQVIS